MQLQWKPSFAANALHATELVATGHTLIDTELQAQLEPVADSLSDLAKKSIVGVERFWDWLIGLSCDYDNDLQLAERVIAKSYGTSGLPRDLTTKLAVLIKHAEVILLERNPKIIEELPKRIGPLQELWNSYGAGLMLQIGQVTDPALIAKHAIVIPVQPLVGGHGDVLLQSNRCWIEAVLTNNNPSLPEVVRLAWLLAQLESEIPIHGELVNTGRLPWISSLAMLPPVLLAAEELELCLFTEDQLLLAIEKWWIPNPTSHSLVETILSWWDTYSSTRPSWRIALTALDKLLS